MTEVAPNRRKQYAASRFLNRRLGRTSFPHSHVGPKIDLSGRALVFLVALFHCVRVGGSPEKRLDRQEQSNQYHQKGKNFHPHPNTQPVPLPYSLEPIGPFKVRRLHIQEQRKHVGRKNKTKEDDEHDKPSPAFLFSISRPKDDQADHHESKAQNPRGIKRFCSLKPSASK